MSLFPRSIYTADTSFTPLFRFLDDFDSYTRDARGSQEGGHHRFHRGRGFNPKFDVRETADAYELNGELPGIERDNLSIDFTEPQTIVIHGRIERRYTAGTPPAGLVEGSEPAAVITETGESPEPASHKATVTDEAAEEAKEIGESSTGEPTPAASEAPKPEEKAKDRYWVSERSVGEFSRTFSFPTRVDQEAVSASLNNGVLSITVPKAKKHESRRIAIN